ncbi:MAG: hypothetical protein J6U08_00575 [Paludibacteraceae bacterium]|nr:hypothetical protein [Paludibacteraceae bacterium]
MARNNFFIGLLVYILAMPMLAWGEDCFGPMDERYNDFLSERATGVSLYDRGKYMEAIPHFEKAYEMCPLDSVLNEYLYFSYKNSLRSMDANKVFRGVPAQSVAMYGLKRSKPLSSIYAEGGALFADSKTAWDDSYIYFERYLVGNGGFASVDVENEVGSVCELNHHVGLTSRTNPVEMKGSNSSYFNLKSKYVGVEYEVSAKFNVSSRWKVMPYARISHESYDEVRFFLDTVDAASSSAYPFGAWNFPWNLNPEITQREDDPNGSSNGTNPEEKGQIPAEGNPTNGWEGNPTNGWEGNNGRDYPGGSNNYWQNGPEWQGFDPGWGNSDANGEDPQGGHNHNNYEYNNMYNVYNNYVGWYNPWWSYLYNPYGQYYGNYTFPEYTPQFWQSLSNSTYKYSHSSMRHRRMDFLVGCLVSYTYGKHVGSLSASYFKGETLKTIQANLSYCIYPFGNLNLYISPKVSYIWRGNDYYPMGELPGNWIGEVEVGGKLLNRLWGSVSYLHGNLCDSHELGSHTFYSLSCETKFRCSARFIYLLNTHCQLSLTYKYLRKESNLFLVDVEGNAGLNVFSQNDNVIAGGVQWNF